MQYKTREHFSNLQFIVFIIVFFIFILSPDFSLLRIPPAHQHTHTHTHTHTNWSVFLWLQNVKGKYSNRDQNPKLRNRKRAPSFPRATIVIVETLRFGYWHLGSIWEGKQNTQRVPLAFPIGSPKCGGYRGLGALRHLGGGEARRVQV